MTEDDKKLVSRAVFAAATDGCIEQQDLVGLIHLIESLSAEVEAATALYKEQAQRHAENLAAQQRHIDQFTDRAEASEARVRALEEALRELRTCLNGEHSYIEAMQDRVDAVLGDSNG